MVLEQPRARQCRHTQSRERPSSNGPSSPLVNALTVDVEDYFHVEAFAGTINRDNWDQLPRRVERNTHRLLDLLAEAGVLGTFFVLGWVARHHPALVRRIVAEGHEIASHGTAHLRADRQTIAEFRADVQNSKILLEDIGGVGVIGYRAPTFSVSRRNTWAHEILAETGFRYSSSIYPIVHDLYGQPDAPRFPFRPTPELVEVPLTTMRIFGRNLPAAGGGYFRLLPYGVSRWLLRGGGRQSEVPCVFYTHPWEIDPQQPRQTSAPRLSRFRHYFNLGRTEGRLRRLLHDFAWGRMDNVFLGSSAVHAPLIETWSEHHRQ